MYKGMHTIWEKGVAYWLVPVRVRAVPFNIQQNGCNLRLIVSSAHALHTSVTDSMAGIEVGE